MEEITLKWFFEMPGILVVGGLVLIILAIIVFIASSEKNKNNNKENKIDISGEVTPIKVDNNSLTNNLVSTTNLTNENLASPTEELSVKSVTDNVGELTSTVQSVPTAMPVVDVPAVTPVVQPVPTTVPVVDVPTVTPVVQPVPTTVPVVDVPTITPVIQPVPTEVPVVDIPTVTPVVQPEPTFDKINMNDIQMIMPSNLNDTDDII